MNDIKFYLLLVMRRIHWIIVLVILGTAAAIWVASTLPPTYRAEVVLVAETEQIPNELAASTVSVNALEQLQIIRQRVLTRNVLIDLANRLNIYAIESDGATIQRDGDAIMQDMRQRVNIDITRTGNTAQQRGGASATIVRVSFTSSNAQLVANVANEVATLIMSENVALRTASARQTLEFFEQEVDRLDQELAQRSAAILEFQQQNLNALPASMEFNRGRLTQVRDRLAQLEQREAELRDTRAHLERMRAISLEQGTNGAGPNSSAEEQELRQLLAERARLTTVLSADNPRVRLLTAQIARAETVVAQQQAQRETAEADGAPPAQMPTSFDLQLIDLDRQLAALARQVPQLEAEVLLLEGVLGEIPGNSVILETLERDYAATQARYNQAVANRARAQTGDTIESLARGQRLSVLEPAVAPRSPDSPNRPLITFMGAFGSAALGLGLVVAMTVLRPVIRRPVDLTKSLGITPFATLPLIRTKAEIFRRRVMIWSGSTAAIIAAGIGVWFLDSQIMPIDQIFESVRDMIG